MKIVILAGGGGTRLFPLSRSSHPKQFLNITGKLSLFAETLSRFQGIVKDTDLIVVTNEDYIHHVKAELQKIHAEGAHILTEPIGRNTGPAIALALAYCKEQLHCADQEVVFVGPSDHLIEPVDQFRHLLLGNATLAQAGNIVTFGIIPSTPETGYGYIETSSTKIGAGIKVKSFKEKPDLETAKKYLAAGNFYWNSGMFMFTIGTMLAELSTYAPAITQITAQGYAKTVQEFPNMPAISIDYAVAEKSAKMVVVPLAGIKWNDIGSFDAIADVLSDKDGNAFRGDVVTDACNNTMIFGDKHLVAGIGLENLLVVDTPDVLLVAKKGESQKVKDLVDKLKTAKRKEVTENVTTYRPWGNYTILAEGKGYKVKKIIVNPGQKLSLQLHHRRSEHWVVTEGVGKLTLDNKVIVFKKNESTFIPIGTRHRLENPTDAPLVIIEVQNGDYLGEDDIVRFDDIYERVKK
jgi:mannose-1-phosphate guanylyltransferase/mannose-6-phosphate isomerase